MSERKVYRTLAKETIGEMMFRLAQKGLNPRRYVTVKKTGKEDRIVKTEKPVRLAVFADRVREQIAEQLNREVWSLPTIESEGPEIASPMIDENLLAKKIEHLSENIASELIIVDRPDVRKWIEPVPKSDSEVLIIKPEEPK
jgi:hypothetical protein